MTNSGKRIEEASLNAWPALRQLIFDGWLLRFANGYTRRANSVNPIYTGSEEVEGKIHLCELFYRERQLPCIFKITPFVHPSNLDELLAELGYRKEAVTSVQVLDLATFTPELSSASQQWPTPADPWIDDYVRMNQVQPQNIATLKAILNHIIPPACYMTLLDNGSSIACGLGVQEGDYVGLFDIVTEPAQRGQGLGQKLIANILRWADNQGAQTAYLQVMLNNASALKLYDKLGFREVYRYWYRVKHK